MYKSSRNVMYSMHLYDRSRHDFVRWIWMACNGSLPPAADSWRHEGVTAMGPFTSNHVLRCELVAPVRTRKTPSEPTGQGRDGPLPRVGGMG